MSLRSQYQPISNATLLANLSSSIVCQPYSGSQLYPTGQVQIIEQQSMSWSATYQPSMAVDSSQYATCNLYDQACCDYYQAGCWYGRGQSPCVFAPSPASNHGWLILLTLVYTGLAWFCSQVGDTLSGGKRWWFLCSPGYWRSRGQKPPAEEVIDGDTQAQEKQQSRDEQSIRIVKLSKDFKGTTALKELTLTMNNGECFALLGHNGAGQC